MRPDILPVTPNEIARVFSDSRLYKLFSSAKRYLFKSEDYASFEVSLDFNANLHFSTLGISTDCETTHGNPGRADDTHKGGLVDCLTLIDFHLYHNKRDIDYINNFSCLDHSESERYKRLDVRPIVAIGSINNEDPNIDLLLLQKGSGNLSWNKLRKMFPHDASEYSSILPSKELANNFNLPGLIHATYLQLMPSPRTRSLNIIGDTDFERFSYQPILEINKVKSRAK